MELKSRLPQRKRCLAKLAPIKFFHKGTVPFRDSEVFLHGCTFAVNFHLVVHVGDVGAKAGTAVYSIALLNRQSFAPDRPV